MTELWPKGSLGWYKEKFQFDIEMLPNGPEKDELQEMLDAIKKKTETGKENDSKR